MYKQLIALLFIGINAHAMNVLLPQQPIIAPPDSSPPDNTFDMERLAHPYTPSLTGEQIKSYIAQMLEGPCEDINKKVPGVPHDNPPLHAMCHFGYASAKDFLIRLLQRGAKPELLNALGKNALHISAERCGSDFLYSNAQLIIQWSDPDLVIKMLNTESKRSETPLVVSLRRKLPWHSNLFLEHHALLSKGCIRTAFVEKPDFSYEGYRRCLAALLGHGLSLEHIEDSKVLVKRHICQQSIAHCQEILGVLIDVQYAAYLEEMALPRKKTFAIPLIKKSSPVYSSYLSIIPVEIIRQLQSFVAKAEVLGRKQGIMECIGCKRRAWQDAIDQYRFCVRCQESKKKI